MLRFIYAKVRKRNIYTLYMYSKYLHKIYTKIYVQKTNL